MHFSKLKIESSFNRFASSKRIGFHWYRLFVSQIFIEYVDCYIANQNLHFFLKKLLEYEIILFAVSINYQESLFGFCNVIALQAK